MFNTMLSFPKKPHNHLYEVDVTVAPGPGCNWPPHLLGARVACYATAKDHFEAVKQTVDKLKQDNYIIKDINSQVNQIPPDKWSEYVEQTWPEVAASFPNQQQVLNGLKNGSVFYGPFCGWEAE